MRQCGFDASGTCGFTQESDQVYQKCVANTPIVDPPVCKGYNPCTCDYAKCKFLQGSYVVPAAGTTAAKTIPISCCVTNDVAVKATADVNPASTALGVYATANAASPVSTSPDSKITPIAQPPTICAQATDLVTSVQTKIDSVVGDAAKVLIQGLEVEKVAIRFYGNINTDPALAAKAVCEIVVFSVPTVDIAGAAKFSTVVNCASKSPLSDPEVNKLAEHFKKACAAELQKPSTAFSVEVTTVVKSAKRAALQDTSSTHVFDVSTQTQSASGAFGIYATLSVLLGFIMLFAL
jgi:hypothetical protein